MSEWIPTSLRGQVRRRAERRCEYCLVHEEDSWVPHVPDHIIALKHHGETRACYVCNNLKGSDLASIDRATGRIVRLFQPRRDRWEKHFRLDGGRIVPLTAIGRVTESLLRLNHPQSLEMRMVLLRAGRYPR
jgi:hypothetical protein